MFYYDKQNSLYASDSDDENPNIDFQSHQDNSCCSRLGGKRSSIVDAKRLLFTLVPLLVTTVVGTVILRTSPLQPHSHSPSSYLPPEPNDLRHHSQPNQQPHPFPQDPNSPILNCGSTRAETLANGCTLDIMGDAWLPSACYNSSAAASAFSSTMLANLTGSGIHD